jgi:hypothetical protein
VSGTTVLKGGGLSNLCGRASACPGSDFSLVRESDSGGGGGEEGGEGGGDGSGARGGARQWISAGGGDPKSMLGFGGFLAAGYRGGGGTNGGWCGGGVASTVGGR